MFCVILTTLFSIENAVISFVFLSYFANKKVSTNYTLNYFPPHVSFYGNVITSGKALFFAQTYSYNFTLYASGAIPPSQPFYNSISFIKP